MEVHTTQILILAYDAISPQFHAIIHSTAQLLEYTYHTASSYIYLDFPRPWAASTQYQSGQKPHLAHKHKEDNCSELTRECVSAPEPVRIANNETAADKHTHQHDLIIASLVLLTAAQPPDPAVKQRCAAGKRNDLM